MEISRWIVGFTLPDLKDKVILDVGSRVGALLWVGSLFSNAKQLIGIEINKTFTDLTTQVSKDFQLNDKIKIINDDILNQPGIIELADVIILHNVFEWFVSDDQKLVELWSLIQKHTKKGSLLLTSPSIEESLSGLNVGFVKFESLFLIFLKIDFDMKKWLKNIHIDYPDEEPGINSEGSGEDLEENQFFENARMIHLYEVL